MTFSLSAQSLYPLPPGWVNPRDGLRLAERGRYGMVVSADETASLIGVDVLKSGGNAVDASVAVAFALAVLLPDAGNIGGGGMMLIHLANGRSEAIDYREMLPSAARPEDYSKRLDRYFGVRSVGVPGTVAALGSVHSRYGRKRWADVLEPARRLAADGVHVSRAMDETLAAVAIRLRDYPEAARIFLQKDGSSPVQNDVLKQPDLARTIGRLQQHGWREFYNGKLAQEIVADLRAQGSLLTIDDWSSNQPQSAEPLVGSYRGHAVITMPPASSGAVALLEMLNILELLPMPQDSAGSTDSAHQMIAVMKLADRDRRRWYGDPALGPADPQELVSKAYAAEATKGIRNGVATSRSSGSSKPEQTTHFAVADAEGNIVSNTYTLQGSLGSMIVPKGTGVLLSGAAAYFDVGSGNRNDVGPRKRAIFSMAPTVVLRTDRKPLLALGLSGGARIPNILMQIIVNVVDYRLGVRDAVDAPRLHAASNSDEVLAEPGALSPDTVEKLRALGHKIVRRTSPLGDAHVIGFNEAGWRYGWSDGRFGGRALGY
jgi:gamma-glutamyltranspeptidase/glutathione hydrolase